MRGIEPGPLGQQPELRAIHNIRAVRFENYSGSSDHVCNMSPKIARKVRPQSRYNYSKYSKILV